MMAVDTFVVYDNIEFSKKGWINRNRILVNGEDAYITLPLKKDSDFMDVVERYLSEDWKNERKRMLNRITESYRKAHCFSTVFPIIEQTIMHEEKNLFAFILNSIKCICEYLEIKTTLIVSSSLLIDHSLKSKEKVIAICKECGATEYINPIGGINLYDKLEFGKEGITLRFLEADKIQYTQFENTFIPFLSIVDVLMFNEKEKVQQHLKLSYTLK